VLTWDVGADNVDWTRIQRSTDGVNFQDICMLVGGYNWFLDTNLTPGTTYYYRTANTNTAGQSPFSNVAVATTSDSAPAAPSNLTASDVGLTQAVLTWQDNSDNELGFRLERSSDGGATFTSIATLGADVNSYVDSGLLPSTSYAYRVRAYNIIGDSANSNVLNVTTLTDTRTPTAVLNAPNLTLGGGSAYQFKVTYTGVDATSLSTSDVLVTGPHGYKQKATIVGTSTSADGSIVATYSIPAPHATWSSKDNGTYKVALQSGQVVDTSGTPLPAQTLGYFSVSISSLGLTAMTTTTTTTTTTTADATGVPTTSSSTDSLLDPTVVNDVVI
jgi:fibronectin type 3 domain-containing protein